MKIKGYSLIEAIISIAILSIVSMCIFTGMYMITANKINNKEYIDELYTADNVCAYLKSIDNDYIESRLFSSEVTFCSYFDNVEEFKELFNNGNLNTIDGLENYNEIAFNKENINKKYGAYFYFQKQFPCDNDFYKVVITIWNIQKGDSSKLKIISYAGR